MPGQIKTSNTSDLIIRGDSIYTIVDGPSWTEAEANANKLGGHLVTINDEEENSFIFNNFDEVLTGFSEGLGLMIGYTDKNNEGSWRWISGENSNYTKWGTGQPDNSRGLENHSVIGGDRGTWNDIQEDWWNLQVSTKKGDVKGLSETKFIRRGDSAYVVVEGPTWEEAEANANKLGGHLVTINDAEENQWLVDNFPHSTSWFTYWIGLNDAKEEGVYKWSSGENSNYFNWRSVSGPNRNSEDKSSLGPSYIELQVNDINESKAGQWNDHPPKHLNNPYGIAEIKIPSTGDTTAPLITGICGGPGASTCSSDFKENGTAIHTYSANETVTWSLSGGSDSGQFRINQSTGALSFASAPDYEKPTDSDSNNSYVTVIQATDGAGNSSSQTVTINVSDVNETSIPNITEPYTSGRILFNKRYINQIRANEKGDALYIDEDNNLYILEGNNAQNTPIPIVDKYGTSPDWLHGDHSSGKRNVFAVENLDTNNYVLAIQHKNMLGETSWEAIQVTNNGVIDWSTSDRKFENYEKYFNEDLDADGVIGINYTQIRNNESGDAIYIDKNNELYILDDNNTNNSFLMIRDQYGTGPDWLHGDHGTGKRYVVAVEAQADSGYVIAVRNEDLLENVKWETYDVTKNGIIDWSTSSYPGTTYLNEIFGETITSIEKNDIAKKWEGSANNNNTQDWEVIDNSGDKLTFDFDLETTFKEKDISIPLSFSQSSNTSTWVYGLEVARASQTDLNRFNLSDEKNLRFSSKDKLLREGEIAVVKDGESSWIVKIIDSLSRVHGDSSDGVLVQYKSLTESNSDFNEIDVILPPTQTNPNLPINFDFDVQTGFKDIGLSIPLSFSAGSHKSSWVYGPNTYRTSQTNFDNFDLAQEEDISYSDKNKLFAENEIILVKGQDSNWIVQILDSYSLSHGDDIDGVQVRYKSVSGSAEAPLIEEGSSSSSPSSDADTDADVFVPITIDQSKQQKIFTNSPTISFTPGEEVALPLLYGTSDDNNALAGITLNVHYNSKLLSPLDNNNGIVDQLPASITANKILFDTHNLDNDNSTDKLVQLVWADFFANFPGISLPASIATLKFNTEKSSKFIDQVTGQSIGTAINYSSTETSSGYSFMPGSTLLKPSSSTSFNLDVDGDGKVTAFGDGLMVIRKLFGAAFSGDALTDKAISPKATRTTEEIDAFIQQGIDEATATTVTSSSTSISTSTPPEIKDGTGPYQKISTKDSTISFEPGKEVTIPIRYETTDSENSTGITMNIHYNSKLLTPSGGDNGITDQLPASITKTATLFDSDDLDNDATTDKIVQLVWADFMGNFPARDLPATVANISFTTPSKSDSIDPLTGEAISTRINFTKDETATGYGFWGVPTTLEASVSAAATRSLDVDGDGKVTAFGDGLMVIRRLFGSAFSGEDLTSKAISPDSIYANEEEPWVAVAANIDALM